MLPAPGAWKSRLEVLVIQDIHAQTFFLAISRYLLIQAAEANDCEPEPIQQKVAVLSVAAIRHQDLPGAGPGSPLPAMQTGQDEFPGRAL